MAEETKPNAAPAEKKAAPAKPPVLEELPFDEFITNHFLPRLKAAFVDLGVNNLNLEFGNFQVRGAWDNRQFTVYFSQADINAQKAFSCTSGGKPVSTIEPFLIDERKAPLELLVFGVIQRLNAQKWLVPN